MLSRSARLKFLPGRSGSFNRFPTVSAVSQTRRNCRLGNTDVFLPFPVFPRIRLLKEAERETPNRETLGGFPCAVLSGPASRCFPKSETRIGKHFLGNTWGVT
jgi:hypothetical protein